MNDDDIEKASAVIQWFGERASQLPAGIGAELALYMAITNSALIEYRHHVVVGRKDPYEALEATARGELKLSQRQKDLWNAMRPPGSALPRL